MKWIHTAGIAASLFVTLLLTGCGDVYRPVVDPFQTPGADPQNTGTAFVLSQGVSDPASCPNPPCQGAVTQIDVPGDSNMAVKYAGVSPWSMYATFSTAYIANRDSGNISFFSPFQGASATVTTISLPAGSQPTFVHSTQSDAIYVALQSTSGGPGSVGVISPGLNQLSQTIPVGTEPVALAETPDKTRLYVVNKSGSGGGVGTVTVIATLDKKVLGTIPVGVAPVYAIATPDSKYVFVLNRGSNSVSILSTANNSQQLGQILVGSSADVTNVPLNNPMYFDSRQQRLYVVNSNDGTLSAFDTSALPTMPAPVSGSPLPLFQLGAPAPRPVSVVALSDGSRVYVANSATNTVSVVDAHNLTISKTIAVGLNPVGVAVSADNSKVYAINYGDPNTAPADNQVGTSVIRTSDNSVVVNIVPPFQDPVKCTSVPWATNTAYTINSFVTPKASPNGHVYQATNAGTSGATEPTWCTTAGCTVEDNTGTNKIVWQEAGTLSNSCQRQRPWAVVIGK